MGKSFLHPTAARTSLGTHGRARTAQGQGGPTGGGGASSESPGGSWSPKGTDKNWKLLGREC